MKIDHLKVDDKVKFAEEKQSYKVQARSERYLICTKPYNPQRTVMYSIVDLQAGIRGPDNMVFCSGYETREQCEERLRELEEGKIEISRRRQIPLVVESFKLKE